MLPVMYVHEFFMKNRKEFFAKYRTCDLSVTAELRRLDRWHSISLRDSVKAGLWTLDWTMDWTMDWIMD